MKQFNIDPSKGPDAAADLPDEDLGKLLQIIMWELAVRTDREQFDGHIRQIAMSRAKAENDLAMARAVRDRREFAAEVQKTIDKLPVAERPEKAPTTGMYL